VMKPSTEISVGHDEGQGAELRREEIQVLLRVPRQQAAEGAVHLELLKQNTPAQALHDGLRQGVLPSPDQARQLVAVLQRLTSQIVQLVCVMTAKRPDAQFERANMSR
jgi:hypothetical protein